MLCNSSKEVVCGMKTTTGCNGDCAIPRRRSKSECAQLGNNGDTFSFSHGLMGVNIWMCIALLFTCPSLTTALSFGGLGRSKLCHPIAPYGSVIIQPQLRCRRPVGEATMRPSLHSEFSSLGSLTSLRVSSNDDTNSPSSDDVSTALLTSSNLSADCADAAIESGASKIETALYKTAINRTLIAVAFSTVFGISVLLFMGQNSAEEFFTSYIVELSLSVDNLFVFLLLFDYFQVPAQYQNRVLNYGIMGSVVMRATMIGLGSAILHRFKPVLLVFAGILIYSSAVALFPDADDDEEEDMGENAIVKFSQSLLPTTDSYDEEKFFTVVDGMKMATPLLICLVAVEISDVVFAVDSIPAVFGVTEDPFIVFTSNMCAILGLRSLYTILSKAANELEYLETSVAIVLGFIGTKMIAEFKGYCISMNMSLAVVVSVLAIGIGLSLLTADKSGETPEVDV